jgi:hypothetical protein
MESYHNEKVIHISLRQNVRLAVAILDPSVREALIYLANLNPGRYGSMQGTANYLHVWHQYWVLLNVKVYCNWSILPWHFMMLSS